MKKVVLVLLAVVLVAATCYSLTGCGYVPTEDDFELTVEIESQEIVLKDGVECNAKIVNKSGKNLKLHFAKSNAFMFAAYDENIDIGTLSLIGDTGFDYVLKKGEDYYAKVQTKNLIKDAAFEKSFTFYVVARFTVGDKEFELRSEEFTIGVVNE